jgi:hypothetical protein
VSENCADGVAMASQADDTDRPREPRDGSGQVGSRCS